MSLLEESFVPFMFPKQFSELTSVVHSLLVFREVLPSLLGVGVGGLDLKVREVNTEESRTSRGSVTLASSSPGQKINILHSHWSTSSKLDK